MPIDKDTETPEFARGYMQGREDAAKVIDKSVELLTDKLKLCSPEVADELSFAVAQMRILSNAIRTWDEILIEAGRRQPSNKRRK